MGRPKVPLEQQREKTRARKLRYHHKVAAERRARAIDTLRSSPGNIAALADAGKLPRAVATALIGRLGITDLSQIQDIEQARRTHGIGTAGLAALETVLASLRK